jgi:hypothetical protein
MGASKSSASGVEFPIERVIAVPEVVETNLDLGLRGWCIRCTLISLPEASWARRSKLFGRDHQDNRIHPMSRPDLSTLVRDDSISSELING